MLSTNDLMFKKRPVKKLMEKYVELYMVEKVVLKNVVKLKLPFSIKIYPVVNRVEEEEVEKILNKRKV